MKDSEAGDEYVHHPLSVSLNFLGDPRNSGLHSKQMTSQDAEGEGQCLHPGFVTQALGSWIAYFLGPAHWPYVKHDPGEEDTQGVRSSAGVRNQTLSFPGSLTGHLHILPCLVTFLSFTFPICKVNITLSSTVI